MKTLDTNVRDQGTEGAGGIGGVRRTWPGASFREEER